MQNRRYDGDFAQPQPTPGTILAPEAPGLTNFGPPGPKLDPEILAPFGAKIPTYKEKAPRKSARIFWPSQKFSRKRKFLKIFAKGENFTPI